MPLLLQWLCVLIRSMDASAFLYDFPFGSLLDPARIPLALLAIVIALVAGVITGPLANNINPLMWAAFGAFFGPVGRRLDRPQRNPADLLFRGFMMMAVALLFGFMLGKGLAYVSAAFPLFGLTEALALSSLLTLGSVWFSLLRLYFALDGKATLTGVVTEPIARSARVDLKGLDDFAITRVAMGYSARIFDKAMVAPVFWYLIGGLPLATAYSFLSALVWRFGRDGFAGFFTAVPMAIEKLMGIAPSLFAGILISLTSFLTPGAAIHRGVSMWLGFKNRAPYDQGGMPLSAMAWTLKISLGGAVRSLDGNPVPGVWTGPEGASARIGHHNLKHALYVSLCAHMLFVAALLGAYIWAGRL